MKVTTDEQFKGILEVFPYEDSQLEKAPFPKAFPFSPSVFQVFDQLKQFVINCTRFAARLNLRWALLKVQEWTTTPVAIACRFLYVYIYLQCSYC